VVFQAQNGRQSQVQPAFGVAAPLAGQVDVRNGKVKELDH